MHRHLLVGLPRLLQLRILGLVNKRWSELPHQRQKYLPWMSSVCVSRIIGCISNFQVALGGLGRVVMKTNLQKVARQQKGQCLPKLCRRLSQNRWNPQIAVGVQEAPLLALRNLSRVSTRTTLTGNGTARTAECPGACLLVVARAQAEKRVSVVYVANSGTDIGGSVPSSILGISHTTKLFVPKRSRRNQGRSTAIHRAREHLRAGTYHQLAAVQLEEPLRKSPALCKNHDKRLTGKPIDLLRPMPRL